MVNGNIKINIDTPKIREASELICGQLRVPNELVEGTLEAASSALQSEDFDNTLFINSLIQFELGLIRRYPEKVRRDLRELLPASEYLSSPEYIPGALEFLELLKQVNKKQGNPQIFRLLEIGTPAASTLATTQEEDHARPLLSFISMVSMLIYLEGERLRGVGKQLSFFWDSFYEPSEGINFDKALIIRERMKYIFIEYATQAKSQQLDSGSTVTLMEDNSAWLSLMSPAE